MTERERLAVKLLLVELLDEEVTAGELWRRARSVRQTLEEWELEVEGAEEDVFLLRSPSQELGVVAEAVLAELFGTARE